MTKKMLGVLAVTILLLLSVAMLPAFAEEETSLGNGFTDILFSNDYRGFCLDNYKDGAYVDDKFTTTSASEATSNIDSSNISQKIKALFIVGFDELFTYDKTAGYVLSDSNMVQSVIWKFTDDRYIWGDQIKLYNKVNEYTGPEIPDSGYTLTLASGDTVTFYFMIMQPQKSDQQDFFAYKVVTNEAPSHTHAPSEEWTTDEDSHWHECECGEKFDVGEHIGGEANCDNKAVCEKCDKEYGELNKEKHTGETEIKGYLEPSYEAPGYTGDTHCKDCGELLEKGTEIPQLHEHNPSEDWVTDEESHWHECECGEKFDEEAHTPSEDWTTDEESHWHECECGEKFDVGEHTGGEANCDNKAVCDTCNKEYGEFNKEKHTGETEIKGYLEPSYEAPGYTGDTHCKDCGALLEKGTEIPQLHAHNPSEDWKTDEDQHWHECECGEKFDEEAHNPSEDWATDEESHWHECECGEKFDEEAHNPSEDWTTDEESHWHECECGEKFDEEAHNPSEDWVTDEESHWHECECGEKFDEEAHNPSEDWTTDEESHWHECECGEKFDEEAHNPSEDWTTDEDLHWHECECGEKFDEGEHTGGEANCDNKAVCENCDKEYGEFNKTNHTGETEIKGYLEPSYEAPGYTGDTHCKDCGALLEKGTEIPQLHAHNPSEDWKTDEDQHWHECECGEKFDEEAHNPSEDWATDEESHWHECECGEKFDEEAHNPSEDWATDEESHWHECECGEKFDEEAHNPSEDWTTDEESHWHECECGEKFDEEAHNPSEDWVTDEESHWHECECGEKFDEEAHNPSEDWTTDEESHWHECECGEKFDEEAHNPSEDWTTDEDLHWHECECGEKFDEGEHTGGEANCDNKAVCENCDKEYGEFNKTNHTGETEIKGYLEPSYEAPGYTGDTHCKDCGELLEKGTEIPQLHAHNPSEDWKTDEDQHWHECECGEKFDEGEHTGGEANCDNKAVCEKCDKEYGELNKENHTGETEIKGYLAPSYEAPGYTGDTHCKDCGELLEKGTEIPQLHAHNPSEDWKTDEDKHWHECECGEKFDEGEHTGGEANCDNKAVCENCDKEYGEFNKTNHTGETEIKGYLEPSYEAPGYTGDIHCKDCGELLEKGTEIPQLHEHNPSEDWVTDEESHWHECECGEKFDEEAHNPSEDWTTDEESHWHECECGEKFDEEAHNPSEDWTTDEESHWHECECGEKFDEEAHNPSEDWTTDEDKHWHECECGEKFDEGEHTGGEANCDNKAVCEKCDKEYGEFNKTNHTGATEIKGYLEPSYEAPGYTGDTYCKDCGELLATGTEIDQLHQHTPSEDWSRDENSHWHDCECGEKLDVSEHDFSEDWTTDEDSHWHDCECGEKSDESEHTGGEPTCSEKAKCEICDTPYGEVDKENQVGETIIKDAVEPSFDAPGYTGDIYCQDCGELLEKGMEIPQLHRHEFSEEWSKNEDSHWHDCECGEKSDEEEHTFENGKCTVCETEDPNYEVTPPEDEEVTPPSDEEETIPPTEEDTTPPSEDKVPSPETGDCSQVYLWMMVSLIMAGAFVFKRKAIR